MWRSTPCSALRLGSRRWRSLSASWGCVQGRLEDAELLRSVAEATVMNAAEPRLRETIRPADATASRLGTGCPAFDGPVQAARVSAAATGEPSWTHAAPAAASSASGDVSSSEDEALGHPVDGAACCANVRRLLDTTACRGNLHRTTKAYQEGRRRLSISTQRRVELWQAAPCAVGVASLAQRRGSVAPEHERLSCTPWRCTATNCRGRSSALHGARRQSCNCSSCSLPTRHHCKRQKNWLITGTEVAAVSTA